MRRDWEKHSDDMMCAEEYPRTKEFMEELKALCLKHKLTIIPVCTSPRAYPQDHVFLLTVPLTDYFEHYLLELKADEDDFIPVDEL